MSRTLEALIFVTGFVLCACTTPPTASHGQTALSVRAVVDDRAALDGQLVTIDGFLSRYGPYFFLSQGTRRPAGNVGENGEEYWCFGVPTTPDIWFGSGRIRTSRSLDLSMIPNDFGAGRRVLVRGQFVDRTRFEGVEEVIMLHATDSALASYHAQRSAGPLRRVEIVRVLEERCDISGYSTDR